VRRPSGRQKHQTGRARTWMAALPECSPARMQLACAASRQSSTNLVILTLNLFTWSSQRPTWGWCGRLRRQHHVVGALPQLRRGLGPASAPSPLSCTMSAALWSAWTVPIWPQPSVRRLRKGGDIRGKPAFGPSRADPAPYRGRNGAERRRHRVQPPPGVGLQHHTTGFDQ
jgi:hypothetical protein